MLSILIDCRPVLKPGANLSLSRPHQMQEGDHTVPDVTERGEHALAPSPPFPVCSLPFHT